MILGITCSSIFQAESNYSFKMGMKLKKFENYKIELINIEILEKENFQELTSLL